MELSKDQIESMRVAISEASAANGLVYRSVILYLKYKRDLIADPVGALRENGQSRNPKGSADMGVELLARARAAELIDAALSDVEALGKAKKAESEAGGKPRRRPMV